MKILFKVILFGAALLLAACQPATAPPQPSATPLPAATLPPPLPTPTPALPTATPSPIPATPVPTATLQPIYVRAFCTSIGQSAKTVVPRGKPVTIIWGWGARTEAQINDHLQNNLTTITLDGKALKGEQMGGIQWDGASNQFKVVWGAPVGALEPGQHLVTYDVSWKKKIEDGDSTYGPGGAHEKAHDECQIIVE